MSLIPQTAFLFVLALIAVKAYEVVVKLLARSTARRRDVESPSSPKAQAVPDGKDALPELGPVSGHSIAQLETMQLHKEMYHKLQNLEEYPDVFPRCWDLLISLLSETMSDALKQPHDGILSISKYTPDRLRAFMQSENSSTTEQWEAYVARRKAGSPREMFGDREEATWWLKQAAPVKYVDGAWLGHINKVTSPFALRHVTKNAWQVMSEELGDGDLTKNHVRVYRDLMRDIGADIPEGDTADFIHPRHELNELRVWKAAIAQLLISLFPHDFLPESLGFNMAYEGLPLHLMKTVKELEELKLNAYYFVLHISIDNAASGHSAMAMEAAIGYIEHMRQTAGDEAAEQAWKRVQAGFLLAEGLPTTPETQTMKKATPPSIPRSAAESAVIDVFKAKAAVAHKIHCNSRLRIGRHTLVEWLEPVAFQKEQRQTDFLHDLSNCRPWVVKGDSGKSRLIRELIWEGKMFGSFTQAEVEVVKMWIDSLGDAPVDSDAYWTFTGRQAISASQRLDRKQDIFRDYPVLSHHDHPHDILDRLHPDLLARQPSHSSLLHLPPLTLGTTTPNPAAFLPLWFAHPALLESFVNIPAKVANPTGSAIVRLLRAQYGFELEGPGVAGMDEVHRTDAVGLVELGLEMARRMGGKKDPRDLREVMEGRDEAFAEMILRLAMRPMEFGNLLFGLTWAFVQLHEAVAESDSLLSEASREILRCIARRERDSLVVCLGELREDGGRHAEVCRGYALGRWEIESCFDGSR